MGSISHACAVAPCIHAKINEQTCCHGVHSTKLLPRRVLTQSQEWCPGSGVYLLGAYAALELGPGALNLAGALTEHWQSA